MGCIDYAYAHILPIYEKNCPGDKRPQNALDAAKERLDGKFKLPYVKNIILKECHAAAWKFEANPAAQAAATIHTPTHSIGLALYGALAAAYDKLGIDADLDTLAAAAAAKWRRRSKPSVAVENEPNPAKINWKC